MKTSCGWERSEHRDLSAFHNALIALGSGPVVDDQDPC
jgi:hypothetical protein